MNFFKEQPKNYNSEIAFYRTGYTGEDGFEISVPHEDAEQLCDELFRNDWLKPAGLGSRDTLRLEAGLCLHGHEINDDISPVESLLQWTIRKNNAKTDFFGKEEFLRIKKEGTKRKRVGIKLKKGGVLREGCEIYTPRGTKVGKVTSGCFSPILKKGVGQGFISNKWRKAGTEVVVDIRGRKKPAEIVKLPFVQ